MTKIILFLRGINMLGHKPIKMSAIQTIIENLGYKNVKTIGASGNIVIETAKENLTALKLELEKQFEQAVGYPIKIVIRTMPELQSLVKADPFKEINLNTNTKRLVTFLSEKPRETTKIPYLSPEKDFEILHTDSKEVFSLAYLTPTRQRTGLLSFLEKQFGKGITTRNWTTIIKIANS